MQDTRNRNQMIHAWCGPACVVGTVIGLVLIARLIPPPPAYLSAVQVASLYREHLLSIRFGLFIAIAATVLLIPFSAAISIQMMRKEGARPLLAFTQLAAGATGALVLIIAFMVMMMAAFDPERPIELTKAIHDMGWLMLLLPYSPFCLQYIMIAMLVLQDTSGRPLFPRWIAYFNIWIAISFIPTGLVGFFRTGPLTWHGLIGFWIPTISYGTWFVVMFLALRSAIRDDSLQHDNTVKSASA
jgi:hypothetical protein